MSDEAKPDPNLQPDAKPEPEPEESIRADSHATPLTDPRQESFARCLAQGMSVSAAAKTAGYRDGGGFPTKLARRPEVRGRAAHLARMRPWSGSRDIAPVIDEMVRVVQAATCLDTAAGCKAVGDLLIKIAELKMTLPSEEAGPAASALPAPMSLEEWITEFQPKP